MGALLTFRVGTKSKDAAAAAENNGSYLDAPVVSMINIFVSALITILLHYVTEVIYQMLLWNHSIMERFWALSL